MLEKTIKQVLRKKIDKWIDSIKDEQLRKSVRNNVMVSGGAITSMVLNEAPNDYDVYFTDRNVTKRVMEYYCGIWNENHKDHMNKLGKKAKLMVLDGLELKKLSDTEVMIPANCSDIVAFLTREPSIFVRWGAQGSVIVSSDEQSENVDNFRGMTRNIMSIAGKDRLIAWMPSDGIAEDKKEGIDENYYEPEDLSVSGAEELISELDSIEHVEENKLLYRPVFITSNAISLSDGIQLITRFYGTPEEIHKNFDFLHAKAHWSSADNSIHIDSMCYEAIINKTLIYTGSLYPVCSILRMRKFVKRGWQINAGQIVKIIFQISKLDLENIDVLEEQLVGVDSLYFVHFINVLRKAKENNPTMEITESYVATVIDKIFG